MNKNILMIVGLLIVAILLGSYFVSNKSADIEVNDADIKVNNMPDTKTMPVVEEDKVNEMVVTAEDLTMTAISTHNNQNDCWLIIEDKVYNVTGFEEKHPGGADAILNGCGKDVTTFFNSIKDGEGHPVNAHNMLKNFYIGDLSAEIDESSVLEEETSDVEMDDLNAQF